MFCTKIKLLLLSKDLGPFSIARLPFNFHFCDTIQEKWIKEGDEYLSVQVKKSKQLKSGHFAFVWFYYINNKKTIVIFILSYLICIFLYYILKTNINKSVYFYLFFFIFIKISNNRYNNRGSRTKNRGSKTETSKKKLKNLLHSILDCGAMTVLVTLLAIEEAIAFAKFKYILFSLQLEFC